jgi:hypothetical protein
MARTTESAVQRLQVGLVGLLVVLLFVSVASMLLDNAGSPSKSATAAGTGKNGEAGKAESTDEPLVELGVTPVVPEQPDKQPAANKTAPQP